jgi:hypothetical protein
MALPRRHAIVRFALSSRRSWDGNLDRHDYGPGTAFLILYPKSTRKYRSSDQKLTISPAQHSPRHHRPHPFRFHLADRFRRLVTAPGFPKVQAQDHCRACPHVGCARDSRSRFYQWRVGFGACREWDWRESCVRCCCCACLVGLDGDYVLLAGWEEGLMWA